MIIGGIAASLLGQPRLTADLDAVILLSTQDLTKLIELAADEGIVIRMDSQLTITIYRSTLGTMLDFLVDKDLASITTDDLRSYITFLVMKCRPERRSSPSSQDPLSTVSPIATGRPCELSSRGPRTLWSCDRLTHSP